MNAGKPDAGAEPGLETIHEATQAYFRLIGKRIDQMRRERRMSQQQMGRILGLSQQTVFNILIGERRLRLDLVAVLARAFGVSADELLACIIHERRFAAHVLVERAR